MLTAPQGPQHHARFQHETGNPETVLKENQEEARKRYYVVIRAFADFSAADEYKKKLIAEKYNAQVYYYPKNKKYHVHVFSSLKSSEAYEEARNLKLYTKLKLATVLVAEEKP